MRIDIITLFPEMFSALEHSIPGRAQKQGLLELAYWNPRDFTTDRHRTVDDRPYGGGPGMLMKVQPLQDAIQAAKQAQSAQNSLVIYLSPQGQQFDQAAARRLAERQNLILLAGRYEGIDERLLHTEVDEQWSIGDFVLSGGELPAMCMIDAITRLLPGALGDAQSAEFDSFTAHLLDYPHYTRPEVVAGLPVPEVLLRGDHAAIQRWRLQQSLGQTWLKRPDLLKKHSINAEEAVLLAKFFSAYEE